MFIAEVFSFAQGREIDEAEVDRLLDFVGKSSCQNHPRDMGFDHLHPADGVGIGVFQTHARNWKSTFHGTLQYQNPGRRN
ncbi:MAG: hypothetical protein QF598_00120 [Arenicellales bacterium]|nr:hypothetical protein [Arenicellales bacterium]